MLANYHTHTERCNHAWGEDREYVEQAIRHGMKVLGFSDHCPWIFDDDDYVSRTRMLPSQLDDYFHSLLSLKKEYEKDITIYIGFESEYIPELMEKQDELFSGYPIDYMILGEHFVESEPYSPYTGSVTFDSELLVKYTDLLIEGMETGKYRYIAHPDLINFIGDSELYKAQMTRLCKYLKAKDIPVEINLLGLRDGRHYPSVQFFDIAKETGNTAIIGCDAHFPQALSDIGPIENCLKWAERFGLKLVDYLPGLEPKTK